MSANADLAAALSTMDRCGVLAIPEGWPGVVSSVHWLPLPTGPSIGVDVTDREDPAGVWPLIIRAAPDTIAILRAQDVRAALTQALGDS